MITNNTNTIYYYYTDIHSAELDTNNTGLFKLTLQYCSKLLSTTHSIHLPSIFNRHSPTTTTTTATATTTTAATVHKQNSTVHIAQNTTVSVVCRARDTVVLADWLTLLIELKTNALK